ncbi:TniQ family protein [Magnetospirillum sp. XM-1]|uniref:TniQ family protein n=1 Tax=Magnetospirillum sp. XM-1 TaxID=1663591 RepID=UPI0009EBBAB2
MILPGTPPPIKGESLNGYLLRLSELNGYANLPQLLKIAGYKGAPYWYKPGIGDRIASLIGMSSDEFKAMSYDRGSKASSRTKAQIFGHDVSYTMLDVTNPKICPACVVDNGYIKSEWDLTSFIACPDHRTILLSRCPHCERKLSWRRPGLLTCACQRPSGRFLNQVNRL